MATPSKDTTPAGSRTQRYRIDARAFLNGTMVQPSEDPKQPRFEYGPPGLHGKALVAVDEAGAPISVPHRPRPVANNDAANMRRQLDAAFAEIEKLKGAVGSAGARQSSAEVAPPPAVVQNTGARK